MQHIYSSSEIININGTGNYEISISTQSLEIEGNLCTLSLTIYIFTFFYIAMDVCLLFPNLF